MRVVSLVDTLTVAPKAIFCSLDLPRQGHEVETHDTNTQMRMRQQVWMMIIIMSGQAENAGEACFVLEDFLDNSSLSMQPIIWVYIRSGDWQLMEWCDN